MCNAIVPGQDKYAASDVLICHAATNNDITCDHTSEHNVGQAGLLVSNGIQTV